MLKTVVVGRKACAAGVEATQKHIDTSIHWWCESGWSGALNVGLNLGLEGEVSADGLALDLSRRSECFHGDAFVHS